MVQNTVHPTLAEGVPYFLASRASAPKPRVVPTSAPVVATTGSHASPVVLILVFLLGAASLLVTLLKDVPIQRLTAAPSILTERHGKVMHVTSALLLGIGIGLLLGIGIGLLATFVLQ